MSDFLGHENTLRALTRNAIADDYEDFEMVVHEITQWSDKRGLSFSEEEIANALLKLVDEGLARAWRLGDSPQQIRVTRQSIAGQDVYFIISASGKLVHAELSPGSVDCSTGTIQTPSTCPIPGPSRPFICVFPGPQVLYFQSNKVLRSKDSCVQST